MPNLVRMDRTLRSRVDQSQPARVWRRLSDAGPTVLAAAIAYNLFFALVPALAALVVAASVLGRSEEVLDETIAAVESVAPAETAAFVGDVIEEVAASVVDTRALVIGVTGLVALWLASRGIHTIQVVLGQIAHQEEHRSWIVTKLVSVLLTAGVAFGLVMSSLLVVGGAAVAEWLQEAVDAQWPERVWNAASLPVATVLFFLIMAGLYRFGPPQRFPGMWLAAFLSTIGAVLASLGFRYYLSEASAAAGTTLAIFGAVAVVLLWLYIIAYVIIVSGVIAASTDDWRQRHHVAVDADQASGAPLPDSDREQVSAAGESS